MPEIEVDPVEGERDELGDGLVGSAGTGERQGKEDLDRVVTGKLAIRPLQRTDGRLVPTDVAQGAAVLEQVDPSARRAASTTSR